MSKAKQRPARKVSARPRSAPLQSWGLWAMIILAVLAFLLPVSSASWGVLYNETDGQYAAAARTMAEGGSWLIPENNGSPRLVKPPFLYWLLAGSFRVFGFNEWAARLPGALGIAFWVLLTGLLGWRVFSDWKPGWMAGWILLTCLGTATLGRIIMPEPWFCAWLTLAMLAGWIALDDGRSARWWAVLFWTSAGLAAFTKGWHGLILPVAVVTLGGLLAGHSRPLRRLLLCWPGLLVAALLNLPWLLYVESRFPGFLSHFFWQEGIGHVAGLDTPETNYDNVPRGVFLLMHFAWFLPWVLLWPLALAFRRHWAKIRGDWWLVVSWVAIGLGILLLVGQRQDYYGMMLWPLFALAVARVWSFGADDPVKWIASILLLVFGAVGLAAAVAFPVWRDFLPPETAALADRATAWQTIPSFDAGVWQSLLFYLATGSSALLLAGIGGLWFLRRKKITAVFALWAGAAAVLSLCAAAGMGRVSPYFSHAELARWLLKNDPQAHVVCFDGGLDTGSSLLFYWGRPIYLVQPHAEPGFAARRFGHGAEFFWKPDDLAIAWNSPERVYLITEESLLHHWQILLPGARAFARSGTQILLGR